MAKDTLGLPDQKKGHLYAIVASFLSLQHASRKQAVANASGEN
jgi:hypothetical protein